MNLRGSSFVCITSNKEKENERRSDYGRREKIGVKSLDLKKMWHRMGKRNKNKYRPLLKAKIAKLSS